jgi:hypothetical protein
MSVFVLKTVSEGQRVPLEGMKDGGGGEEAYSVYLPLE